MIWQKIFSMYRERADRLVGPSESPTSGHFVEKHRLPELRASRKDHLRTPDRAFLMDRKSSRHSLR